jgi:hypothetical protein
MSMTEFQQSINYVNHKLQTMQLGQSDRLKDYQAIMFFHACKFPIVLEVKKNG